MIPRVLMAHAQKLEAEVKTMKSKIKELQTALASAQRATPPNTHGSTSFLTSKSPQDCDPDLSMHPNYAEVDEITTEMGSVSIGSDGQTKYHGSFAGSEVSTSVYTILWTYAISVHSTCRGSSWLVLSTRCWS